MIARVVLRSLLSLADETDLPSKNRRSWSCAVVALPGLGSDKD
jgi:hypothetical protein